MADSATSPRQSVPEEPGERRLTGEPPAAEQTVAPLPDETFELRPPPPVRALAIASVAALAGAVLVVVTSHPAPVVGGIVLLVFGVLLSAAALLMTARLRTEVRLSTSQLSVVHGRRRQTLGWSEITKVEQRGHRLLVRATEPGRELVIIVPDRRTTTYARLLDSLRLRLDKSRGYGTAF